MAVQRARSRATGNQRRASERRCVATLLCALALLACATARAQQVSVQMRADRDRMTVDQVVTVQIKIETAGVSSPDEELPSFDGFEIVRRSVSRPMQFSFSFGTGRGSQRMVRSSTEYTFVLRPLTLGRIQIPPVVARAGGKTYQSRPLVITVEHGAGPPPVPAPGPPSPPLQPGAAPADESEPPAIPIEGGRFDEQAFLRTVADKAEAYLGEQVTVTVDLYLSGRLRSVPSVQSEPGTGGFWVRDLLPSNRQLTGRRRVVGGTVFSVYTLRRFAAFPLREGELVIEPMSVTIERGTVFDPFDLFRRRSARQLQRTGVPLTIRVKPLPESGKPSGEVAVGRYQLEAKLDRDQVATGDAVTLTATVRGQGNISTVRLAAPEAAGLQVLQPEIRDLVESPNDRVGGTRVFEWLLVPQQPGNYNIGPLQLPTFGPATGSYSSARSEPLVLTAVGASKQVVEEKADSEEAMPDEPPEKPSYRFGPVRTSSALGRRNGRLVTESWYPWVAALGPLGWLLVLSFSMARRRLQQNAERSAPRRAFGQAERRLREAISRGNEMEAAAFHGELSAAIKTALESRLGEPVGGFTHPELRAHLQARGMSAELAGRAVEELKGCEVARFSPAGASAEQRQQCGKRARELFREIGKFTPREKEPGR